MVFEGLLSDLIDCFWWFDDSSAESFGVHAPNSKESREPGVPLKTISSLLF